MKKLFGLFILAAALVLSSCGNGFTDETGDVSFSIPGNQLVRMVASARDGKTSEGNSTKIAVIVQVMGSKGYYASQTQETSYTSSANGNVGQSGGNLSGNTALVVENPVVNAVKDLTFSFPKLPVSQRYTIYLDVISSYGEKGKVQEEKWQINYSGESSDVRIKANASTPVQVSVFTPKYNPLNDDIGFEVTYDKNGTKETKIFSRSEICGYNEYSVGSDGQMVTKNHPATQVFSNIESKLYFGGAGRTGYPVTDVKYVFMDNSHFKRSGQITIRSEADVTPTLFEILKNTTTTYYSSPVIEFGDYVISGNNTDIAVNIRTTSFGGGDNGYGVFKPYTFKKDTEDTGNYRYYAMIPLTEFLGDASIQKNESIALVLTQLSIKDGSYNEVTHRNSFGSNSDPGYGNFAYIFQKQKDLPIEQRYEKNVTIDFDESQNVLIISGNFLTGEEKYLQLFFDVDYNTYTDNETLNGQFNIQYKIYSAEEKAYVFHSSYYGTTSRYEMIYPLNDILPKKPAGGDTVKITLSGKVERPFWGTSNPSADDNKVFRSEFFDNASYKNDPTDLYATSYHPLSQEDAQGNDPIIDIGSDGKFPRPFTFASIKAPGTPDNGKPNDFRFQCINELQSGTLDKLLVIRDFDISVKIQ